MHIHHSFSLRNNTQPYACPPGDGEGGEDEYEIETSQGLAPQPCAGMKYMAGRIQPEQLEGLGRQGMHGDPLFIADAIGFVGIPCLVGGFVLAGFLVPPAVFCIA